MSDEGLKPCPFCGGEANMYANYNRTCHCWFVFCQCTVCGGTGKTKSTKIDPVLSDWNDLACKEAVSSWNRRSEQRRAI